MSGLSVLSEGLDLRGDERSLVMSFTGTVLEVGRLANGQDDRVMEIGITLGMGDRRFSVTGLSRLEARAFAPHLHRQVTLAIAAIAPVEVERPKP